MQEIIPNLWFDGDAKEAAEFYTSVFSDGEITETMHYPTEGLLDFQKDLAGDVLTVDFELLGHRFTAINAGPEFSPNPSISFFVNCESKEAVDELWEKLIDGGTALMSLDSYDFSERYGWVQDKYGVSWQLIFADPEGDWRPKIVPSLLFTKSVNGRAEEAIKFYTTVFADSEIGQLARRDEADQGVKAEAGSLAFGDFKIENDWLAAMDGGEAHEFTFNEGISLSVQCKGQEEIDELWEALSADPDAEQCGWLKDKYGVSWQIVPETINELMFNVDGSAKPGVYAAMMEMKKLDIKKLKEAHEEA